MRILFVFVFMLSLVSCSNTTEDGSSEMKSENSIDDINSEKTDDRTSFNVTPESKYNFVIEKSCGFDRSLINEKVYYFDSDLEAENALNKIMELTGLPANFKIKAATVDNACAVIKCDENGDCDRYILYNQEFMEKVKNETGTSFSELAILSHEIAHHLSGHTLTQKGSNYDDELEADIYAGHILFKLGANIDEVKKTYSSLSENGSSTHPPKNARINALCNGYFNAKNKGGNIDNENTKKNDSKIKGKKYRSAYEALINVEPTTGEWKKWHFCTSNGNLHIKNEAKTATCDGCFKTYLLYWKPEHWVDIETMKRDFELGPEVK